jgi:hypothetical protein
MQFARLTRNYDGLKLPAGSIGEVERIIADGYAFEVAFEVDVILGGAVHEPKRRTVVPVPRDAVELLNSLTELPIAS